MFEIFAHKIQIIIYTLFCPVRYMKNHIKKRGIHFAGPLPSNDEKDMHTDTLTDWNDV